MLDFGVPIESPMPCKSIPPGSTAYLFVAGHVARSDDKITVPGWISFQQTTRAARTGRNPRTGEPIDIPATKGVKVTAGSKLKNAAKGK